MLQLQRTLGNQAVDKLLSRIRPRPVIQTKLAVDAADDAYEQELADRAAAPVVSDTTPEVPSAPRAGEEDELQAKPLASAITPLLQRETQEEELQAKFVQCATSETGRFDSIQRQRLEDQRVAIEGGSGQ